MGVLKIVAAIVIYNKEIEKSITYKNLHDINNKNIEILIIDNSENDMGNQKYCEKKGINYISMGGNAGLSRAYNVAIEASLQKDIIVLFDDDTEITREYFEELFKASQEKLDVDIFAPIIYGQDGIIYSPNEFNFLKNHFITYAEQEIPQESFNAIASCLAIRMRVFDKYRFNEKLFVDQVDQHFFYEQRELGKKFMKLNVKIKQNFYQRAEKLESNAGWKRLRLRILDIMRQTRLIGGAKIRILGLVKCCGLGVQIGMKCKSVKVVFKAIFLSLKSFVVV